MQIAIAVNNVSVLGPTWTTVHLMDAFLRAGHDLHLIEGLEFDVSAGGHASSGGHLEARAWQFSPPSPGIDGLSLRLQDRSVPRARLRVSRCDLLLLRVNPLRPELLTFGMLAEEAGVRVVNSPAGVACTSSKAWLATLNGIPRPHTLITRSRSEAHRFARELGRTVVVKPMAGSGGRGVQRIPPNQAVLLDRALDFLYYTGHFVIQEYLTEADAGEKRLVWADGEILGAYLRQRTEGEFRHNLRQGSEPHPCQIAPEDRDLGRLLAPHLARNGIRIAGLDVIGGRLVEVNTLNPGGIHYAELLRDAPGPRLADRVVQLLTHTEVPLYP